MAGNTTLNSSPVIRGHIYSELVMEQLDDGFLPDGLARDVTDFGDGTQLEIPTVGEMTIYDIDPEQEPHKVTELDTGKIYLTINQFKGTGGAVSDKLKEDAYKWQAVEAQIVPSSLRQLKAAYETDLLAQSNNQTAADPNTINGFDHRWVAGATNNVISLEDFIYMNLSFNKADVPEEGRIAIVDPVVAATFDNLSNIVNVSNNPMFEGMVTSGFKRGRRFVRNVYGWDVWTSNRLPRIASETIVGGPQAASTAITSGVANVFMCVVDDMTMPFMSAWRRMPRVRGYRNEPWERDEFYISGRWGMGLQRAETLGVVITAAGNYK